jgi:predicted amidohydrolase
VLSRAGADEEIVLATCDLARVAAVQQAWRFLDNRRPDAYAGLTR